MTRLRPEDAEARQSRGESRDFLEVLARSIHVIDTLGKLGGHPTLSDIARATNLPKPTVRRILHTLGSLGYVELSDRAFRLTPKIMRLATGYLGTSGNTRVLQTVCDRVTKATGQSCLAGVLDGGDVLVIGYSISQQLMAPSLGVGAQFPAFCSAAGRVLLSFKSDSELDEFMAALDPVALTEATITDKKKIRAAILQARSDGFSQMEDEFALGWRTCAYPLRRFDNAVFGTLSVNCRKSPSLSEEQFAEIAALCQREARLLQATLV